jgi:hypothetical protein
MLHLKNFESSKKHALRVLLLLGVVFSGVNTHRVFSTSDYEAVPVASTPQVVLLETVTKDWMAEELMLRLPSRFLERGNPGKRTFSLNFREHYQMVVSTSKDEIFITINDLETKERVSDFSANHSQRGFWMGSYSISVLFDEQTHVRISKSNAGAPKVLAEKTLDKPLSLPPSGFPIVVKALALEELPTIEMSMGRYEIKGEFGVPVTISHTVRAITVAWLVGWSLSSFLSRRESRAKV